MTASLNRADLDGTLARVLSKPNVSGTLILAKETGAIIRSTLADNDLAKKYSLGVKRTQSSIAPLLTIGLLQSSKEVTQDINEDVVSLWRRRLMSRMIYGCCGCGRRSMNC